MNKWKININQRGYNLLAGLSFLILSFIYVFVFIKMGKLQVVSDGSFHLARVEEIYDNFRDGSFFTFVATHEFHHSGVGNFLFYPSVYLYIWAAFRLFLNPITSYYTWIGLFLFITMMVSYFSMMDFSNTNKKRSYVFALLYTLANYHFYLGIANETLGEYQAYSFLPLLFLGIYHLLWGNDKKWYIAPIGLALISYAHILSVYISVGFAIILFMCKLIWSKKVSKKRLIAIIKAIGLATLLVGVILVPFITDLMNGNIQSPIITILFNQTLMDIVNSSFNNLLTKTISPALLLGMLFVFPFIKKDKKEFLIYLSGLLILGVSTTLFPWDLLGKTSLMPIIGRIQFPYRLLPYATVLMSVSVSYLVTVILNKKSSKYKNIIVMLGIASLFSGLYYSQMSSYIFKLNDNNSYLKAPNKKVEMIPDEVIVNKNNYNNIFKYSVRYGETDYTHKQTFNGNIIDSNKNAKTIMSQDVYLGNKKINVLKAENKPNKNNYVVKIDKSGNLDIPFISYHKTYAKVNGKNVSIKESPRGGSMVKVNKGMNHIEIGYQPIKLFWILMIVSIISWLVTVGYLLVARRGRI